ncbi:unnamed protein product [Bemisia tabaci]|uniref:Chorion peroxidase n=2 Tax=Bemisia tabaci TaxID=7038 RepID=A0A9P0AGW9_BEMTA|nr:unnamed protein product [Bemisia tabaci]
MLMLLTTWTDAWHAQSQWDKDCVVYLRESSHYDKSLETRRKEKSSCITIEDVNAAWWSACDKIGVRRKAEDANPDDIAQVGEALQETARLLVRWFHLKPDEIPLLQQIDTTQTHIREVCPTVVNTTRLYCTPTRYRRLDGACNNIRYPLRGAALLPFKRLLPAQYADGISEPRKGHIEKFSLPNARTVSAQVHKDVQKPTYRDVNFMFAAWGQLIDHDLTLTAETKDPVSRRDIECCHGAKHANCMPIELPPEDEFYRSHSQSCVNFVRSLAGVRPDCRLGYRVQTNALTSYIDANFVYGSNEKIGSLLREFKEGKLRTMPIYEGLKPILPLKKFQPDDGCIRPHRDLFCFLAGDNRVNEQLALTMLHTVMLREHNRIADQLCKLNPHWDDEKIYQETRAIVAAEVQHITYAEFLPRLLGRASIIQNGLGLQKQGYSNKYNPTIDPTVPAVFGAAAFRFGHSLLPETMERWSSSHTKISGRPLKEVFQQPYDLNKPGWIDEYILGMLNQAAQAMDPFVTKEVTNHLFQEPAHDYGKDLASINIERAREHGIPSYAEYRKWCNLSSVDTWSDMQLVVDNNTVKMYRKLYRFPTDVDLWSAGVAEIPEDGSIVGPTFNCIIARTFKDLKEGDRFWYENGEYPNSFTPSQLQEIRKVRLARLLCDNSDSIVTIQPAAMKLPHEDVNRRVSCKSAVIPSMDLRHWQEYPKKVPAQIINEEYDNLSPVDFEDIKASTEALGHHSHCDHDH